MMTMWHRACLLLAVSALPAVCGDWNPRLAEQYLDARQKLWAAWPRANQSGVTCISCHTSLPYLMARPSLRAALGERERTPYETGLIAGVRSRSAAATAQELFPQIKGGGSDHEFGTQSVLAALLLSMEDAQAGAMSPEAEKAFERLWAAQVESGPDRGAWQWTDAKLDPWETADSPYYGAALAALATGIAPQDYQSRQAIKRNIAALTAYLREGRASQPLHNQLTLAWASTRLRGTLADAERRAIVDAVRQKQGADGGWSLEALGGWKAHPNAPPSTGSNAYATAIVAFTLEKAGVERADPMVERALGWLREHQNAETGSWDALSMNKRYEPESMQMQFMRDAATGYATAALLEGVKERTMAAR